MIRLGMELVWPLLQVACKRDDGYCRSSIIVRCRTLAKSLTWGDSLFRTLHQILVATGDFTILFLRPRYSHFAALDSSVSVSVVVSGAFFPSTVTDPFRP